MSTTPDSIGPDGQLPLSPDFEPLDHHSNGSSSNTTSTSQKMESVGQQQHHDAPEASTLFREDSAPPSALEPFDWAEFTARYEAALKDAKEEEKAILKEAESLSRYFSAWASAASVHDDERATKRLQTRQRFVNLSEEKMAQKQKHYEEVVRAFESALALLRSS